VCDNKISGTDSGGDRYSDEQHPASLWRFYGPGVVYGIYTDVMT